LLPRSQTRPTGESAEGYITALPYKLYDALQPYSQAQRRSGPPQHQPRRQRRPRQQPEEKRPHSDQPQRAQHPQQGGRRRRRRSGRSGAAKRRRRSRPPRVTRQHRQHRLDEALDDLHAVERATPGDRTAVRRARSRVGRVNSAIAQQHLRHQFNTAEKDCVDGILAAARTQRTTAETSTPTATMAGPPPLSPALGQSATDTSDQLGQSRAATSVTWTAPLATAASGQSLARPPAQPQPGPWVPAQTRPRWVRIAPTRRPALDFRRRRGPQRHSVSPHPVRWKGSRARLPAAHTLLWPRRAGQRAGSKPAPQARIQAGTGGPPTLGLPQAPHAQAAPASARRSAPEASPAFATPPGRLPDWVAPGAEHATIPTSSPAGVRAPRLRAVASPRHPRNLPQRRRRRTAPRQTRALAPFSPAGQPARCPCPSCQAPRSRPLRHAPSLRRTAFACVGPAPRRTMPRPTLRPATRRPTSCMIPTPRRATRRLSRLPVLYPWPPPARRAPRLSGSQASWPLLPSPSPQSGMTLALPVWRRRPIPTPCRPCWAR
jgi:hypothetical protein